MYSKIKIYGSCDIDYLWTKKDALLEYEISNLKERGISEIERTADTIILVNFNGNTDDTSMGVNSSVYKYLVQRRDISTNSIEDVVCTSWNQIQDWSCQSSKTYEYLITPIYLDDSQNEVFGQRIITNPVSTDWSCISIVDLIATDQKGYYKVDKNNIWTFSGNVEDITFTTNNDVNFINTYSRFPREHRGKNNYLTTSITCLLGDIFSCDYKDDNIAKIEAFRDFCNNGKLKLFKDYKGNVVPCSISSNKDTADGSTVAHQTTISFDIVQLASRESVSAFYEVI